MDTKRIRSILPILLILLAPAVMLYTLWGNPVSAGEDDIIYYYPMRKMVGQKLAKLQWPLENPYEATGMPLMADPQSAVMYPPTWLFATMDAKSAYSLTLMLAFAVAGLGTYGYLRAIGLARVAGVFGAVAMMFCGFLVGHRVHWSIIHTAAWLPWGLWCIERLGARPLGAMAGIVLVAYLALTAGHWPTFIHMGVIWMVYLLLRARPLARSMVAAGAAMFLVMLLAAPQLDATVRLMGAVTRNAIGYSMAGENSYFPASAVLMLFPMLFGCRTANFFPTQWWGPWHLCETLGYVGLVTLVLAFVGVWTLYRKKTQKNISRGGRGEEKGEDGKVSSASGDSPLVAGDADRVDHFRKLVRVWTWIGIGAMVWMLGYYLPTYRLIHMLPVLGIVRCPARMILAVDMALVTIASITVHLVIAGAGPWSQRLASSVRRGATVSLPVAMALAVALTAAVGGLSVWLWGGYLPFFEGTGSTALESVLPTNPAVWVQVVLAIVTIAVVRWWLAVPRRRAAVLVALLLADLFFVTRFVDVPAGGAAAPDPEDSPATRWLAKHGANPGSYCVWGIGETYHDRPAELLRPKTAHGLGISTINTYGPFQSAAHAQLFEFQIFGTNRNWASLIRRNDLLTAYGVRYILTARKDVREVLESVRLPTGPQPEDGPNLLTGMWRLSGAESNRGILTLQTPVMWRWSTARKTVRVRPDTIYRISLDACGPDGGAANYLRAELHTPGRDRPWPVKDPLGLMAFADQIGQGWRHFEWTFKTPADIDGEVEFRVYTMSERPIEVRRVRLRESHWDQPRSLWRDPGRFDPGTHLYELRAELPPCRPGDEPVAIYENRVVQYWGGVRQSRQMSPEGVETAKWHNPLWLTIPSPASKGKRNRKLPLLPPVGVKVTHRPRSMLPAALAGLILYLVLLSAGRAEAGVRRQHAS